MNHKQQQKYLMQKYMNINAISSAQDYCNKVVNMNILIMLVTLGDKFDFTGEQMEQLLKYTAATSENIATEKMYNTKTEPEMLKQILLEEYNFNYNEVVMQAFEKFNKEVGVRKND